MTTEERLSALETGIAGFDSRLQVVETAKVSLTQQGDSNANQVTTLDQAKTSQENRISTAEQALTTLTARMATVEETLSTTGYNALTGLLYLPFYSDGHVEIMDPVGSVDIPNNYGGLVLETSTAMEIEGFTFQLNLSAVLTNTGLSIRTAAGQINLDATRFTSTGLYLVKYVNGAWKTGKIGDNLA